MLGLPIHVQLFAASWTAARQAPLPMGFPRQECWRGVPLSSPGDLPNPGIEPATLLSSTLADGFFITSATLKIKSINLKNLEQMKN